MGCICFIDFISHNNHNTYLDEKYLYIQINDTLKKTDAPTTFDIDKSIKFGLVILGQSPHSDFFRLTKRLMDASVILRQSIQFNSTRLDKCLTDASVIFLWLVQCKLHKLIRY